MFDKDFSFSKTEINQDQTDLTNIQSHSTLPPSFNLHTLQKSTPMRPTPAPRMFAPTPNDDNDTSVEYVTARQLSV
jgi:hypothetical protein